MGRMISGGVLICGSFGLSFTDWTVVTLIVGFLGAVLFFWGFLKVFKSRKKG